MTGMCARFENFELVVSFLLFIINNDKYLNGESFDCEDMDMPSVHCTRCKVHEFCHEIKNVWKMVVHM